MGAHNAPVICQQVGNVSTHNALAIVSSLEEFLGNIFQYLFFGN